MGVFGVIRVPIAVWYALSTTDKLDTPPTSPAPLYTLHLRLGWALVNAIAERGNGGGLAVLIAQCVAMELRELSIELS